MSEMTLVEMQENNLIVYGKYRQIPKMVFGSEIAWSDEYNGPNGIGYIEYREKTEAGKIYKKATDYGPEKRSHDWIEIVKI